MTTLLVLGSKPEPVLPPRAAIDAVACANASGYSASRHGLPVPEYTVMSAILTSGKSSGRHSIAVLRGLATRALYLVPRPDRGGGPGRRALRRLRGWRMEPPYFRIELCRAGYHFDRFEVRPLAAYHELVRDLCGHDPAVAEQMQRKQPSTGVFAVALGVADPRFSRVVVAGMSFELTHSYGPNPEIAERGSATSKHADTDVLVLRRLARCSGRLFTSEPIVAERAGVPLLAAVGTPPAPVAVAEGTRPCPS